MRYSKLNKGGVSLVEVVLAIAIIGILVLLLANLPNSIRLIGRSRNQSLAREIAAKGIEDVRSTAYANLAYTPPGGESIIDSRISLLPQGTGNRLIENCSPSICTQAEEVKQVTITVNWNDLGNNRSVVLTTLVAEGGLNQ